MCVRVRVRVSVLCVCVIEKTSSLALKEGKMGVK